MEKDIIASRQCSVGPEGHFMPGPGQGPVTISINFYRPALDPEQAPDLYPSWQCAYEIRYGERVVHAFTADGMDGVAALLSAMVHVVSDLDNRYFNACSEPLPYVDAIPRAYFEDMRNAG